MLFNPVTTPSDLRAAKASNDTKTLHNAILGLERLIFEKDEALGFYVRSLQMTAKVLDTKGCSFEADSIDAVADGIERLRS